jgi:hypothetical protein
MLTLCPAKTSTRTRDKGWDHSQSETKKVLSLLPRSKSEQERLQKLTLWPAETSTRTRDKSWDHWQSEVISSIKFNAVHERWHPIHMTQACNKNMESQKAWVSNIIISSFNFCKLQISWLGTISCNREQKIHNHPSMQQQYSKTKSMGKQSNSFIYKFLQSNKMISNKLLR